MGKPTSLFAMGEEARGEVQTVAPRPEEEVAGALPDAPEEAMREVAASQGGGEESVETTEKVDGEEEAQTNGVSPESKKKTPSGGHSLTPQPFAETRPEDSPDRKSSARRSPRKTPNGTRFATRSASPSRPQPQQNGTTTASLHPNETNGSNETPAAEEEEEEEEEEIPPTRFEIFPPIPGLVSAAKRKPGRPPRGGSRRSITYGTPTATANRNRRRRSTNNTTRTRTSTDRSPGTALRRTRSKLGEAALVMNASDDEEEEEEEEEGKIAVREAADEDVAVEEEVDGEGVREVGGREEEDGDFDGEEEAGMEGHEEDAEGSEEEEEIKYD
ncbi:hypothetical protein KC335_g19315 [Hortaea werneckii]|nr:hypothetical protein KC352_g38755 [Hortaea werneckii]KAI7246720.1 hypothetical protein KC335_g19315 [Hortaea werneckii]